MCSWCCFTNIQDLKREMLVFVLIKFMRSRKPHKLGIDYIHNYISSKYIPCKLFSSGTSTEQSLSYVHSTFVPFWRHGVAYLLHYAVVYLLHFTEITLFCGLITKWLVGHGYLLGAWNTKASVLYTQVEIAPSDHNWFWACFFKKKCIWILKLFYLLALEIDGNVGYIT